jgi:hypothetical protein
MKPFVAPPVTVFTFDVGQPINHARGGDAILVYNAPAMASRIIRFGQGLRARTRPYRDWSHAALALEEGLDPPIAQAVTRGVVISKLSELEDTYRALISPQVSDAERYSAVEFGRWSVGEGYGWLSLLGDALDDLTTLHLTVGTMGRIICSALVCRAHERLGLIPDVESSMCAPADLARYYNVPDPKGRLKGRT